MPFKLHFDAVNAVGGHVYARILKGQPESVQPVICGTMWLSLEEWQTVCKILAAATSPEFIFTHQLHMSPCDKCGEELARVTCGLCNSHMCESCWSDHPHVYGLHIEGSTK